jgi:hypothetical protein
MRTEHTIIPKPIWLVASLDVPVVAAACASEVDAARTAAPGDRASEQADGADVAGARAAEGNMIAVVDPGDSVLSYTGTIEAMP